MSARPNHLPPTNVTGAEEAHVRDSGSFSDWTDHTKCGEKIRELEAELAKANASASGFAGRYSDAVARAEKAEQQLAEVRKDGLWYKARDAELERLPTGLHRHEGQSQVCGCEAREREEP